MDYVMTKEQREQYVKHLHKKTDADHVDCQWCGKNEWIPSNHFVAPWICTPKGEVTLNNAPLIPMHLFTCGNCGYTMHFNAIISGAFEKKDE